MDAAKGSTERAIHVGVNAHLLSLGESYRGAGINWYIQNLLKHLPEIEPQNRYTVFVGERRYVGAAGIDLQVSRLPTRHPLSRILWEQAVQPWAVQKAGLDLIHGTAFVGPLAGVCPSVVTVHDLSFLFYPLGFRAVNRVYLRLFCQLSVRRAKRVIAVSESTKRDLIQVYGLSPGKVDVAHNGVDPGFHPLPAVDVAAFRAEHGLPDRFMLFIGTLEPRKNLVRLIEAYARLPRSRPPLMLVGGKGWLYEEIFARVEALNLDDEVCFVGFVPAEDLPFWYNAATLFIYPSLYEGFGLPPLEAMACGTPVVYSNASSLPEVMGEAGLMVDPNNSEALAAAMEQMLVDPDLQASSRAAGLAQASRFSWQESAARTVETYHRALMVGTGVDSRRQGGEGRV
jgi:glycosyltransferase involved in cell wall biosynthesis